MFQDFKPILIMLLRFVLIYIGLILVYQLYLNSQEGLDVISTWVGNQVCAVQEAGGYDSFMREYPDHKMAHFVLDNIAVSRMVEGCNAISVMILFLAFIFAFYRGGKTFVFAAVGLLVLHVSNILRIAGINILYIYDRDYFKIGHDYFFPAIIYGTVVLLWIVWIKFFALRK